MGRAGNMSIETVGKLLLAVIALVILAALLFSLTGKADNLINPLLKSVIG